MDTGSLGPPIKPPRPAQGASKRLFFDRRYGWVFDEWKDPSEEALAGGRGMFCIVPIGKALLNVASLSINVATDVAVTALKDPNQFSPRAVQANVCTHFQKLVHLVQRPNLKLITFHREPPRNGTQTV